MQRNSYHSGMSTSMSRPSSSPKVPTFDGTVSAQFRPWIIQFETIARHQCWTLGERVVRLVSSLTGPAANLLSGMTMGQLDDYTVQITFIFIGQTHLVFGKRVCTCVTKHSNAFRTFLNWLKNSKRVWHERKLHILLLPIFANFDL